MGYQKGKGSHLYNSPMKTTAEKRAYARGYNAGTKIREASREADRQVMTSLIERAQRAEAAAGLGCCANCQHWQRESVRTKWGECHSRNLKGNKPWPWPWFRLDVDMPTKQLPLPFTSEDFGCVLFMSRNTATPAQAGAPLHEKAPP